jgi:hypothetical protein
MDAPPNIPEAPNMAIAAARRMLEWYDNASDEAVVARALIDLNEACRLARSNAPLKWTPPENMQ